MVVVLGEGGGGRQVKSGWDCRKVEVDSGDFQRWMVVWSEEGQCGQRGEGYAPILWR